MTTPATMIGRYRVEALLGQGGMGQVFRAWDEVLERRVAIKVLRAGGAPGNTEATNRRILREARAAAALAHPNVVAIHDVGEHEGAPYIVMEHVSGASLRAYVGHPEIPAATRAGWLVDVARALAAAHRAGLVHRDVKPENVMVREDGVVKVLDFGIARRASGAAPAGGPAALPEGAALLQTAGATVEEGRFVGTPAYVAPEQLRVGEVDARADQFAWGVVGYELLTGVSPWRSGTDVAAVLRDVLFSEPRAIDAAAIGVAPAFAAAVHRALAKAREDRFPSMEALLAAIGAAAAEAPGASIPPPAATASGRLPSGPVRVVTGDSAGGDDRTMRVPEELVQLQATAPSVPEATVAAALGAAATEAFALPADTGAAASTSTSTAASTDTSAPVVTATSAPASTSTPTDTGATAPATSAPAATSTPAQAVAAPVPRRGRSLAAGVAAAVIVAGATASFAWRRPKPAAPVPAASAAAAPLAFAPRNVRRLTSQHGCEEFPAFTPDGREVIFDATTGRDTHVYALDLATNRQRPITEERGWQWAPAVSPDGRQIAFVRQQDGKTAAHVVAIEGGPSRHVADGPVRPTFTPDGRAVWAGARTAAVRVDLATGATTRTLDPPPGHEILSVRELPDGRIVARFWDHDLPMLKGLGVYEPGAAAPRMLSDDALTDAAAISPDGRWLLAARPRHDEGLELTAFPLGGGAAVPVAAKSVLPTAGMALAPGGERLIWSTCRSRGRIDVLARREGKLAVKDPAGAANDWLDRQPAAVPGTSLVVLVSTRVGGQRLWVVDRAEREPPREIPIEGGGADAPAVTPDGKWIVFAKLGEGLHVVPLAGGAPRRLTSGAGDTAPSVSRDGATVYFQARGEGGQTRIDAVPFAGGAPRTVRERAARPAASPAADRLAFVALGDGGDEGVPTVLDLRSGEEAPLAREIGRGRHPGLRFSPDGRRVAVLDGTTTVVEVDAGTGAVLGRHDAGNEDVLGMTYTGEEILVAYRGWSGNLWAADGPRSAP